MKLILFTLILFVIIKAEGLPVGQKMVNLYGRVSLSAKRTMAAGIQNMGERPADPTTLLEKAQLEERAAQLLEWWQDKTSVLCITGAGLSTESGIPDYRGHKGSYHRGHKPVIHSQYMDSEFQRKRYWGRSMVGWKKFDSAKPNVSILCRSN